MDPRLTAFVALGRLQARRDDTMSIIERRASAARTSHRFGWLAMPHGDRRVSHVDVTVPVDGGRIRVRVHTPPVTGPSPLHVFIHGGGWCAGTVEERDPRCRQIAAGAGCVVASVDYRLAPECQYPTAPEDCWAALLWLVEHADRLGIDPTRISVGGESAGANLAAVLTLMTRDRSGPDLCWQWLDVPAVDLTCSLPGHTEVPDGYLLDTESIDDYVGCYVPDPGRRTEPYCSPLFADDHHGLPPAWIMSAGLDHLCTDADAYAAALRGADVPVTETRLDEQIHMSFALTRLLPESREYEATAISALADAFSRR